MINFKLLYNGNIKIIDQDNRPKYIVYGINNPNVSYLNFQTYSLDKIKSFIIASDGLEDLLDTGFDKGELFVPPFPNLYGNSNGQICWGGGQKLAKYTDPKQLIFAIDEFFSAAFNDDL